MRVVPRWRMHSGVWNRKVAVFAPLFQSTRAIADSPASGTVTGTRWRRAHARLATLLSPDIARRLADETEALQAPER